jgi:hypothetical protein
MPDQQGPENEGKTNRQRPQSGYKPEPIPWHFKVLGILFLPYLAFRLWQIAHWIFDGH